MADKKLFSVTITLLYSIHNFTISVSIMCLEYVHMHFSRVLSVNYLHKVHKYDFLNANYP